MMLSMLEDPQTDTSLHDLLALQMKPLIRRDGIHTVDAGRHDYQHHLLKMCSMGNFRFD